MIPQIQCKPTAFIWEGSQGILDEDGQLILDETGHSLQADAGDSRPVVPPTVGVGLVAWYKADALNQLNGTGVNPWTDSGSNGNDLQSSDAAKTLYFIDPLVRWGGLAQIARYVGFGGGGSPALGGSRTGCTWLYVGRRTGATSFANLFTVAVSRLTLDGCMEESVIGSTIAINIPGLATVNITLGDWHVMSFSYDDAENVQRFQTNDQSVSGPIAGGGAGHVPIDALQLQHEFGEVKEWLVYRQKLSATDLDNARQYLARKYGIAAQ